MITEAGRRLLQESFQGEWMTRPIEECEALVAAIEAEARIDGRAQGVDYARADIQGRLDLLIHVCQDIVRDAGTAKWPVNLDRLRMALDELGALEEGG